MRKIYDDLIQDIRREFFIPPRKFPTFEKLYNTELLSWNQEQWPGFFLGLNQPVKVGHNNLYIERRMFGGPFFNLLYYSIPFLMRRQFGKYEISPGLSGLESV